VQAVDPGLAGICTILPSEIFALASDFEVSLILHTLTSTLTQPYLWAVNCARAVESMARLVSPDEESPSRRWQRLRETLNVSWTQLKLITKASTGRVTVI
jgi:hypothetical protein